MSQPEEPKDNLLEPELGWDAAANFRRQKYAAYFLEILNDYFAGNEIQDEKIDNLMDAISRHGSTEAGVLVWEAVQPNVAVGELADASEVRDYLANFFMRAPIKMKSLGSLDDELVRDLRLTSDNYIEEIHLMLDQIPEDKRDLSVFDLPRLRTKKIYEEQRAYKKLVAHLIFELHGVSLPLKEGDDETTWSEVYKIVERISQEVYRDYLKQLRNKKKEAGEQITLEELWKVLDTLDEHRENQIAAARIGLASSPAELRRFLENYPQSMRERIQDYVGAMQEDKSEDSEVDQQ